MLKLHLGQVAQSRLDTSARLIQRKIYGKVRLLNACRQLRKDIAKLPIIVRASAVQMFWLKQATLNLENEAKQTTKKPSKV